MLAVIHQVEVVGEFDVPGNLLQDVDTETLAALFDVGASHCCAVTVAHTHKKKQHTRTHIVWVRRRFKHDTSVRDWPWIL